MTLAEKVQEPFRFNARKHDMDGYASCMNDWERDDYINTKINELTQSELLERISDALQSAIDKRIAGLNESMNRNQRWNL